MLRNSRILLVLLMAFSVGTPILAQSTPAPSAPPTAPPTAEQAQIIKNTEAFVRDLFAWGPEFKVEIGPLAPSSSPAFYQVPLKVTINGQTDTGSVFVGKDGKTFFRGEMFDMTANPFAGNLAKLHIEGNPSIGPADARVTIVEFSDFQCPHCRQFHQVLQTILPQYPQVRVVFKDFPLTQVHPWAETAAIGARCAFIQSPKAFWQVHDQIFDEQEVISAENIWDKLISYAAQAGLDADAFKTCMSSPEAKQAVDANHSDGEALAINSTPAVFINGHPLPSGDQAIVEQYLKYDLARAK